MVVNDMGRPHAKTPSIALRRAPTVRAA